MAEYKKVSELPAGIQSALKRVTAGNANAKVGAAALAQFKNIPNRNVEAAQWRVGDSAVIPDEATLGGQAFVQPVGDNMAAGVMLTTEAGVDKQLFLSSLKKSAVEYDDELKPGRVVQSNTALHDEAMKCGDQSEIFNLLVQNAGKKLVAKDVVTVRTARFVDNAPVGHRNTNVVFFDIE